MKEMIVVLTLLGCDDAGIQCNYIQSSEQRWDSVEACQVASEALLTEIGAAYPTTAAECAVVDTGPVITLVDIGAQAPAMPTVSPELDQAGAVASPPARFGAPRRWMAGSVRTVVAQPARFASFARQTANRVTGLLPAW